MTWPGYLLEAGFIFVYIVNYKYNLNENKVKKITSYLLTRYWCIWNKILQQEMTTPSWINLFKINSKGIRTTSTIFFFDIKSYSRINYTNCSWVFIGITLSNIYNEAFLWKKNQRSKAFTISVKKLRYMW